MHADGRKRVDLTIAASPADVGAMERTLRNPLGRLPVEVVWKHAERVDASEVITPKQGDGAFARIWLDVTSAQTATLYLADAPWERILVRHVGLPKGLDEVAREELAFIVRSSIDALLSGSQIGMTRAQAQTELAPQTAPPKAERHGTGAGEVHKAARVPPRGRADREGIRLGVGALYEAQLLRAGNVWHGPGVLVGARGEGAVRAAGVLSLQYRSPTEVASSPLGARFQGFSLRTLARVEWVGPRLALAGGAGIGIDTVYVKPIRAEGAVARVDPPRWITAPLVRATAAPGVRISGESFLWLVTGVDADFVESNYSVLRAGVWKNSFSTWQVRPFLGLEFSASTGVSL